MPIATIQIVKGRDLQTTQEMMSAVAVALSEKLDAPLDTVKVIVQEIPPDLWCSGSETIAARIQRRNAQAGGATV